MLPQTVVTWLVHFLLQNTVFLKMILNKAERYSDGETPPCLVLVMQQ